MELPKEIEKMNIVLFDGVCVFCDSTVDAIIKHDKEGKMKFASLQSELGQKIMNFCGYHNNELATIVFIKEKEVFTKSQAIIEICKLLVGFPRLFVVLEIIPPKIRDFLYSFFSKYRYNLFGKKSQCNIPTQEKRARYLI